MIQINRFTQAQDQCMVWRLFGNIDGVPFCGELSRDFDYDHESGPIPDHTELCEAFYNNPELVKDAESLETKWDFSGD